MKYIEINYPHEEFAVHLKGEDRVEDLQSLMCQGQGIYRGIEHVSMILGDDTESWKHMMLGLIREFSWAVNSRDNPLRPTNSCISAGQYVCITKKGKFVLAEMENVDGKFKWNRDDVILYFPSGSKSVKELLIDNNLLNQN